MDDKYKNSRRFAIALYSIVTVIMALAVYIMGDAAAPILTTTLPAMLVHAMAYSHTTNKGDK